VFQIPLGSLADSSLRAPSLVFHPDEIYSDKVTVPFSSTFSLLYLSVSRVVLLSVAINLSFESVRNVEWMYIEITRRQES
jgi:hypothetical protein